MSSLLSAEIAAACNALGYFNGKKYLKDRYCLETVKELIRHLRRDGKEHEARRLLGEAKVLQKDLIPLLKEYHEDKELFNVLLRLLVNLTHPALLLFREEEPSDPHEHQLYLSILSHQQDYKAAFVDDTVMSVLAKQLGGLLEIEWTERDEDCNLNIERILILLRNVLQVPADLQDEQRADNDASIHDQVLWACHTSGINAIFLYLSSTESEQPFYMHILEILSQMLREQCPAKLATAAAARSVEERRRDESELAKLRQAENEARQAKVKLYTGARHSKFGGTYYVQNVKSVSDRDLIYSKPLHSLSTIDFDLNKTKIKAPKNRRPEVMETMERRSAYSIRLFLKELCVEFLNGAYNALMFHVKDSLVRHRGQDNDESYYLWAIKFFMEFNRHYKFRIELVSETMSVQTFHWVQTQLDRCQEMVQALKKARKNWVKRQHLALKAYQELLMTLLAMDKSGDDSVRNSARVIKSNIFYVVEYREMSQHLLQSFDPTKLPLSYLRDLVETNHVFLKMLEHFCKTSSIVVQRKKRKQKTKKSKNKKGAEEAPKLPPKKTREELWEDGLAEELSAVIQGDPTLPETPVPFDATSEKPIDEQKIDCMLRIQRNLKERKFEDSIALLKAAIEVWPELCAHESGELLTDDQFLALKDIFLADLPGSEEPEEQPAETVDSDQSEVDTDDEDVNDGFTEITEQNFNFDEFILRFCHPRVMAACGLVLRDFHKPNTTMQQVHAAVKLMHRICMDCKRPAMAFQASLFRTFQRALKAQKQKSPLAAISKELAQFGQFIVHYFAKVSRTNPHVFIELLFWKTGREAVDIVSGYGTYENQMVNKHAWTEVQEDELTRLHSELRDKMQRDEGHVDEKLLVDEIWDNLIDTRTRSRMAVYKKLKELGLITGAKGGRGGAGRGGQRNWSEEDLEQLREMFDLFKESDDPVAFIAENMTNKRSRQTLRKKLIELGIADKAALAKKRGGKKGNRKAHRPGPSSPAGRSDSGSDSGSDSDVERPFPRYEEKQATTHVYSKERTIRAVKMLLANGMASSVRWVMTSLNEAAEDRTTEEAEPVPLVPLSEDDCEAVEDSTFLSLLRSLGFSEPIEGQEAHWRIPAKLSLADILEQAETLAKALDGRLQALDSSAAPTTNQDAPSTRRPRTLLDSDSEVSDTETALQRQISGTSTQITESTRKVSSDDENIETPSSNIQKNKSRDDGSSDDGLLPKFKSSKKKTKTNKKKEKVSKKVQVDSSSDDESTEALPLSKKKKSNGKTSSSKIVRPEVSSDEERMQIDLSSENEENNTNDNKPKKRVSRMLDSSDDETANQNEVVDNEESTSQSRKRIRESSDEEGSVATPKLSATKKRQQLDSDSDNETSTAINGTAAGDDNDGEGASPSKPTRRIIIEEDSD